MITQLHTQAVPVIMHSLQRMNNEEVVSNHHIIELGI